MKTSLLLSSLVGPLLLAHLVHCTPVALEPKDEVDLNKRANPEELTRGFGRLLFDSNAHDDPDAGLAALSALNRGHEIGTSRSSNSRASPSTSSDQSYRLRQLGRVSYLDQVVNANLRTPGPGWKNEAALNDWRQQTRASWTQNIHHHALHNGQEPRWYFLSDGTPLVPFSRIKNGQRIERMRIQPLPARGSRKKSPAQYRWVDEMPDRSRLVVWSERGEVQPLEGHAEEGQSNVEHDE